MRDPGSDHLPTSPPPRPDRTVQYRGEPLDPERGPGLGCFWTQVAVLSIVVILTPLSVAWSWPSIVSAGLLLLVILLLFFTGQTVIFLLRLVAAERRATGRRRPMASATRTVGEIEDEQRSASHEQRSASHEQRSASHEQRSASHEQRPAGLETPLADGAPDRERDHADDRPDGQGLVRQ